MQNGQLMNLGTGIRSLRGGGGIKITQSYKEIYDMTFLRYLTMELLQNKWVTTKQLDWLIDWPCVLCILKKCWGSPPVIWKVIFCVSLKSPSYASTCIISTPSLLFSGTLTWYKGWRLRGTLSFSSTILMRTSWRANFGTSPPSWAYTVSQ